MWKHLVRTAAIGLCWLPVHAMAAPQTASDTGGTGWTWPPRLTLEAGIGHLSGRADELSYDTSPRRLISQLHWQVNDAAVVKGSIGLGLTDWLTAGVSGWTVVASDNVVDDYDWNVAPYTQWSDHSHHPDTRMPTAWQGAFDIAARLYHDHGVSLSVLGGYQWTHFKWAAYGGSYIYSVTTFRDTAGLFPASQLDSTYSQSFGAPFLGASAAYAFGHGWQIGVTAKGSPWAVDASDVDHHVLRQLIYWDKANQAHLWSLRGAVAYDIEPGLQIEGSLEAQVYTQGEGPTTVLDQSNNTTTVFAGNASGIRSQMLMLSAAIRYAM